MFSILISLITLIGVCAGAAAGMTLRRSLPEGHVTGDSRDAIKLGAGLIATMTALLLSLLIASAKSFYDTQNSEFIDMSAKVALLDRMLAPLWSRYKTCSRDAVGPGQPDLVSD